MELDPRDRERLQVEWLDRWFLKRPRDRAVAFHYARIRAINEVRKQAGQVETFEETRQSLLTRVE